MANVIGQWAAVGRPKCEVTTITLARPGGGGLASPQQDKKYETKLILLIILQVIVHYNYLYLLSIRYIF